MIGPIFKDMLPDDRGHAKQKRQRCKEKYVKILEPVFVGISVKLTHITQYTDVIIVPT